MNKSLLTVTVILCLGLSSGFGSRVHAQDLPEGLVGYWTFDDGSGDFAADALEANPGTLNGPVWADGIVGGALDFDGFNDWVDFGTSDVFKLYPPLSVEVWIYPRETTDSWVISKGDKRFRYLALGFLAPVPWDPENLYFWVESAGSDIDGPEWVHQEGLETGRWHHVVGVHDGENLTLWVDGSPRETKPSPVWNHDSSTAPLTAGNEPSYFNDANKWFDGLMDEMAIYDRALTEEEIETHHRNGLAGRGLTESAQDQLWIPNDVVFSHVGDEDTILSGDDLSSRVELLTTLMNFSSWEDPWVYSPQLELADSYPVDWIQYDWMEGEKYLDLGSEYLWQFPHLPAYNSHRVHVGFAPEVEPVNFESPFSLTRVVSEPEIDAPGGLQTVTVTLTIDQDQFMGEPLSDVSLWMWGGWDDDYQYYASFPVSFVDDDENFVCDLEEGGNFVSCHDWSPTLGTTYEVQATFDLQLFGAWAKVAYMPAVVIEAHFGGMNDVSIDYSMSLPTDYGTWTWSSADLRNWHTAYSQQLHYQLDSRIKVLNHFPEALCQNVVFPVNICEADASIDAGSYDPDGDEFTLLQHPSGPYGWWTEDVKLEVTDKYGATSTCFAQVIGSSTDADGDLWPVCQGDCDDADPTINPGEQEMCDGRDNNCDGFIDEGYPDTDVDLIPDCLDNCLATHNTDQADWNGDGTGDACQDSDSDGLLDVTEIEMAGAANKCPYPDYPNSDEDTLSDGDEVALGTDPCSEDTDNDGVPDGEDPLPTEPGVTGSYLEEQLREANETVQVLDLTFFTHKNPNANKGRRNALGNKFNSVANLVAQEDYEAAMGQLQSILLKVDGQPVPPDWLNDGPEKTLLYELVILYMELLELM